MNIGFQKLAQKEFDRGCNGDEDEELTLAIADLSRPISALHSASSPFSLPISSRSEDLGDSPSLPDGFPDGSLFATGKPSDSVPPRWIPYSPVLSWWCSSRTAPPARPRRMNDLAPMDGSKDVERRIILSSEPRVLPSA